MSTTEKLRKMVEAEVQVVAKEIFGSTFVSMEGSEVTLKAGDATIVVEVETEHATNAWQRAILHFHLENEDCAKFVDTLWPKCSLTRDAFSVGGAAVFYPQLFNDANNRVFMEHPITLWMIGHAYKLLHGKWPPCTFFDAYRTQPVVGEQPPIGAKPADVGEMLLDATSAALKQIAKNGHVILTSKRVADTLRSFFEVAYLGGGSYRVATAKPTEPYEATTTALEQLSKNGSILISSEKLADTLRPFFDVVDYGGSYRVSTKPVDATSSVLEQITKSGSAVTDKKVADTLRPLFDVSYLGAGSCRVSAKPVAAKPTEPFDFTTIALEQLFKCGSFMVCATTDKRVVDALRLFFDVAEWGTGYRVTLKTAAAATPTEPYEATTTALEQLSKHGSVLICNKKIVDTLRPFFDVVDNGASYRVCVKSEPAQSGATLKDAAIESALHQITKDGVVETSKWVADTLKTFFDVSGSNGKYVVRVRPCTTCQGVKKTLGHLSEGVSSVLVFPETAAVLAPFFDVSDRNVSVKAPKPCTTCVRLKKSIGDASELLRVAK